MSLMNTLNKQAEFNNLPESLEALHQAAAAIIAKKGDELSARPRYFKQFKLS